MKSYYFHGAILSLLILLSNCQSSILPSPDAQTSAYDKDEKIEDTTKGARPQVVLLKDKHNP